MRSISRTINKILIGIVVVLACRGALCAPKCPAKERFNINGYNADVLCEKDGRYFVLKYLPKTGKISLVGSGVDNKFDTTIHLLQKNANPELVGDEKSINFVTSSVVLEGGRSFIAVTYSERSTRGNGSGQCGAGSEVYFAPIEVFKNRLSLLNRYLVYSCIHSLYLDAGDGNNNDHSIEMDGTHVVLKWLTFEDKDGPVQGRYDFLKNELIIDGEIVSPVGTKH